MGRTMALRKTYIPSLTDICPLTGFTSKHLKGTLFLISLKLSKLENFQKTKAKNPKTLPI